jgi:hypothetical protein
VGGNAVAFGANKLQWGYQQLYNVYKANVSKTNFINYLNSIEPTPLTGPLAKLPNTDSFYVVDTCFSSACTKLSKKGAMKGAPQLCSPGPCTDQVLHSSYLTGNAQLPAAYLGWLIGDKLQSQTPVAQQAGGGNIWMLSGEPEFFGAQKNGTCVWTPALLQDFYTQLIANLKKSCSTGLNSTKKANLPCEFSQYKFGIWNFSALTTCLQNKSKTSVQ